MRTLVKAILGLAPACIMTLGALMFVGFISSPLQWMLLACAITGTGGMIWSLAGYSRNQAVVLFLMLLVGIAGAFTGLYTGIAVLLSDAHTGKLGTPAALLQRSAVIAWLMAGPAIVGLAEAWNALRVLRAGSKTAG